MNIKQALILAHQRFLEHKTPSARLDAEILLSHTLGKERIFLFTHPEYTLTTKEGNKFFRYLGRRIKGEPVAYLTHHKEFYGRDFYVNKDVLIPRPETENMIQEIFTFQPRGTSPIIIDVGTGSGCIAIILAELFPKAKIFATDISSKALRIAQKNTARHGLTQRIIFLKGNLLDCLPQEVWSAKQTKIIAANLPYLSERHKEEIVTPNSCSLKFEPEKALFGGREGLKYYQNLLQQLKEKVPTLKSSTLFFEISPLQKSGIKRIIKKFFPRAEIQTKKDLAGLDRIVIVDCK